MPDNADVIAQKILENPAEFLPKAAMQHVNKAQAELVLALKEIAKLADGEYVKQNQEEFKRMYKALYPAASSSVDFNKKVMDAVYSKIQAYEVSAAKPILDLEKEFYSEKTELTEKQVIGIRQQMLDKIRNMIEAEAGIGVGPGHAAFPAAIGAVAAAVAAAVEVVTLVRSVVSSNYIDRLIRTEKLNPRLVQMNHTQVVNSMRRINVIRDGMIR